MNSKNIEGAMGGVATHASQPTGWPVNLCPVIVPWPPGWLKTGHASPGRPNPPVDPSPLSSDLPDKGTPSSAQVSAPSENVPAAEPIRPLEAKSLPTPATASGPAMHPESGSDGNTLEWE